MIIETINYVWKKRIAIFMKTNLKALGKSQDLKKTAFELGAGEF